MSGRKRCTRILVPALLIGLASGCSQGDLDRLNRVGVKTKQKLTGATKSAKGRLALGWASLESAETPPLSERVERRLRWDKKLQSAAIQVIAKDDVIELRGELADESQKARALDLAGTTLGVSRIVDGLRIKPITDAAKISRR